MNCHYCGVCNKKVEELNLGSRILLWFARVTQETYSRGFLESRRYMRTLLVLFILIFSLGQRKQTYNVAKLKWQRHRSS